MEMTAIDRNRKCPIKSHRICSFCGECEYVCEACDEKGWYSTAGQGGGTYRLNDLTNEELIKGRIVMRGPRAVPSYYEEFCG